MLSADNLCKQFGPRSGPTKKKLILKKASRRQEKHEILSRMQRVKEGVNACALSAIRRRAVKSSGETAKLVRITCAFFGHSCNKDLISWASLLLMCNQ